MRRIASQGGALRNNAVSRVVRKYDISDLTGFNHLKVNSLSKRFVPGMHDVSEDEFALFRFSFKTSKYEHFTDKIESTTMEYGLIGGEFETPVLDIIGDEGFDVFDVLTYSKTLIGTKTEYSKKPEFGLYADYSSTYWKRKAKPLYQDMDKVLRLCRISEKQKSVLSREDGTNRNHEITTNINSGSVNIRFRLASLKDYSRTFLSQPKVSTKKLKN